MKERDDELEDLFRERFSEKEAPVSPRVWNNIKKTLPQEDDSKRRFWGNPKKFFGISISALLVATALWWAFSPDAENNLPVISENTAVEQQAPQNSQETVSHANEMNSSDNNESQDLENLNPDYNQPGKGRKEATLVENEDNRGNAKNKISIANSKTKQSNQIGGERQNISGKNSESGFEEVKAARKKANDVKSDSEQWEETTVSENKIIQKTNQYNPTNKDTGISEDRDSGKMDNKNAGDRNINTKSLFISKDENKNDSFIVTADQKGKKVSEKNPGLQNDGKDKITVSEHEQTKEKYSTTEVPSTSDSKDSEKLHIWSEDSSASVNSKEHYQESRNEQPLILDSNSGPNQKKIMEDTLSTVPTVVESSLDTLAKADTLTNVKADSTISADSSTKKIKEKKDKQSRWSLDLMAGPMFTGASTNANDLSYQDIVNAKNEQDKNRLNFSGGGMLNYALSQRFSVSAGVLYSSYSEKYNFRNTKDTFDLTSHIEIDSVPFQDSTGSGYTIVEKTVIDTNRVSKQYSDQKKDQYNFISIPLNATVYLWRKEKLSISAIGGVRINLLTRSRTYITNNNITELVEYSGETRKITLSYMASVAMEYQLKKKMYLLVQPTVNYQAGSIYTNSSALNQKPYSVGVNVGIRFKF